MVKMQSNITSAQCHILLAQRQPPQCHILPAQEQAPLLEFHHTIIFIAIFRLPHARVLFSRNFFVLELLLIEGAPRVRCTVLLLHQQKTEMERLLFSQRP